MDMDGCNCNATPWPSGQSLINWFGCLAISLWCNSLKKLSGRRCSGQGLPPLFFWPHKIVGNSMLVMLCVDFLVILLSFLSNFLQSPQCLSRPLHVWSRSCQGKNDIAHYICDTKLASAIVIDVTNWLKTLVATWNGYRGPSTNVFLLAIQIVLCIVLFIFVAARLLKNKRLTWRDTYCSLLHSNVWQTRLNIYNNDNQNPSNLFLPITLGLPCCFVAGNFDTWTVCCELWFEVVVAKTLISF